jgi:hypothetical protein
MHAQQSDSSRARLPDHALTLDGMRMAVALSNFVRVRAFLRIGPVAIAKR